MFEKLKRLFKKPAKLEIPNGFETVWHNYDAVTGKEMAVVENSKLKVKQQEQLRAYVYNNSHENISTRATIQLVMPYMLITNDGTCICYCYIAQALAEFKSMLKGYVQQNVSTA